MKKFAAFLLTLVLLAAPMTAFAAPDTVPSWAADSYDKLEAAGIDLSGLGSAGTATREEFMQMLVAITEYVLPYSAWGYIERMPSDHFDDSNPSYALRGAAYGIISGSATSDGRLLLNRYGSLTRQEAAKFVCNMLDFFESQGYVFETSDSPAEYADAQLIDEWAKESAARVASYRLMIGDNKGNFSPKGLLENAACLVIGARLLDMLTNSALAKIPGTAYASELDWTDAGNFGRDARNFLGRPNAGAATGHYISADDAGNITAVIVPSEKRRFDYEGEDTGAQFEYPTEFQVERYDTDGNIVFSKTVPMELPIFGALLAGEDCFYVAYGQFNLNEDDSAETFRIAKYDYDWNLVGYASANGGETYTTSPFESAIARMALNDDGTELVLHAARERYTSDDGRRHQSNITFILDTAAMEFKEIWGEEFPLNYVSHSFGQFVRYDGDLFYTVDHGDAYPRSFYLQDSSGETVKVPAEQEGWYYTVPKYAMDLFEIWGAAGENVTNAIGSGFEISSTGYLFLLCSDSQSGGTGEPWNVYLVYADRGFETKTTFKLTDSTEGIDTARLVKIDDETFVAMWAENGGVALQTIDAEGNLIDEKRFHENLPMPPTEPVLIDGDICWLQTYDAELLNISSNIISGGKPYLFRVSALGE